MAGIAGIACPYVVLRHTSSDALHLRQEVTENAHHRPLQAPVVQNKAKGFQRVQFSH